MLVRVLSVPEACQPGDAVFQEGGAPPAEYPKECKVGRAAAVAGKWGRQSVSGSPTAALAGGLRDCVSVLLTLHPRLPRSPRSGRRSWRGRWRWRAASRATGARRWSRRTGPSRWQQTCRMARAFTEGCAGGDGGVPSHVNTRPANSGAQLLCGGTRRQRAPAAAGLGGPGAVPKRGCHTSPPDCARQGADSGRFCNAKFVPRGSRGPGLESTAAAARLVRALNCLPHCTCIHHRRLLQYRHRLRASGSMTEPAEAQQPKRRRQHLPGTPTMPSQPPSALASGSAAGHARPTATGCKNCIDCAQSLTWSKAALCR